MGLRPTNSDKKHAQRRRPGERSVAPVVFLRGVNMGLRPTNSDEKHAQRRMPGEYGGAPGRVFQGSGQTRQVDWLFRAVRLRRSGSDGERETQSGTTNARRPAKGPSPRSAPPFKFRIMAASLNALRPLWPLFHNPASSRIIRRARGGTYFARVPLKGGAMFDRHERHCPITALTLLVVSGFAGAATAAETSDSRLPEAARTQDAKTVRTLLSHKADVNARSSDGSTALLWLAHWNDVETAELLLTRGRGRELGERFPHDAVIASVHQWKRRVCAAAPEIGRESKLGRSHRRNPADDLRQDRQRGRSPSAGGIRRGGQRERANAEPDGVDVGRRGTSPERGERAHRVTCGSQSPYQRRVHRDTLRGAGRGSGERPVVAGRRSGCEPPDADWRRRRRSYAEGAQGSGAATGYTPLLVATMRAQVDVALYLLDHGADPNIDAAGFTPLHWASTTWEGFASNPVYGFEDPMSGIPDRQAKLRLVKALLAHGAKCERAHDQAPAVVRHRIHGRRRSDPFAARRLSRRRGDDAHSARRPAPIPKSPRQPMRQPSWRRRA